MRATIALSLALLALTATPSESHAQDRDRARGLFDEASTQFEAGNFLLALDGFQQARSLMEGDERAQTLILFNIARTQEELQQYREALATFERYLAEASEDAPYLAQTRDRVRELRLRVASMPAAATQASASSTSSGSGSNDALVIVGIATLVVGAALGGLSAGLFAERERNAAMWNDDVECLPANGTRMEACGDYQAAALDNETLGIGLAVGAGAALVGGAVLLAIGATSGGGSADRADFTCTGGPGLVGLACGASF